MVVGSVLAGAAKRFFTHLRDWGATGIRLYPGLGYTRDPGVPQTQVYLGLGYTWGPGTCSGRIEATEVLSRVQEAEIIDQGTKKQPKPTKTNRNPGTPPRPEGTYIKALTVHPGPVSTNGNLLSRTIPD